MRFPVKSENGGKPWFPISECMNTWLGKLKLRMKPSATAMKDRKLYAQPNRKHTTLGCSIRENIHLEYIIAMQCKLQMSNIPCNSANGQQYLCIESPFNHQWVSVANLLFSHILMVELRGYSIIFLQSLGFLFPERQSYNRIDDTFFEAEQNLFNWCVDACVCGPRLRAHNNNTTIYTIAVVLHSSTERSNGMEIWKTRMCIGAEASAHAKAFQNWQKKPIFCCGVLPILIHTAICKIEERLFPTDATYCYFGD